MTMTIERLSEHVQSLASSVVMQGDAAQRAAGERSVMLATLAALVATHPDPEGFAAAFRRCWMLLGQPNSDVELGAEAISGIDELLDVLEEFCPVPLRVRPDREP